MPQTWIEINLTALAHNAQKTRQLVGNNKIIYGVVKANAYGCGSIEVSHCLIQNGIDRLAVTHVQEGIELRQSGIEVPILVMGPTASEDVDNLIKHKLTPAISTLESLENIAEKVQQKGLQNYPIHVKIETGLGRTGLFPFQVTNITKAILDHPELYLEGAFTHLATATTGKGNYVHQQVAAFSEAIHTMEAAGATIPIKHVANSAATLAYPQYHFDAVRVGTLLYGQNPGVTTDKTPTLQEAWSFKTKIAHLADLPSGHGVGYGRAHITGRPTKIAVLPVGYIDGYQLEPISVPVNLWDLTKILLKTTAAYFGIGSLARNVRIKGKTVPVLGKVAMQFTMIDVTSVKDIKIGDTVELPARRTVINSNLPRVYKEQESQEKQELALG
ncbi:alanine racemase [Heliorestis convoluta]|uniref:Alanine racemase n=1 Tax=Heliorestis convoluta TaxID=356322 RepID=A0A5Q2MZZ8_9FIRM|nr:alanine racemase [Heliorestis convoluta]QGG47079.1 alanine racemase [Heliorestis convoluta]